MADRCGRRAKVPAGDPSDYAIDHTGFFYLLDAGGHYLGFFPPGTTADRLADVVRPALDATPASR